MSFDGVMYVVKCLMRSEFFWFACVQHSVVELCVYRFVELMLYASVVMSAWNSSLSGLPNSFKAVG